ncbi:MAG: hypothetical protein V4795_00450 [Pseudomonadota bacterium]
MPNFGPAGACPVCNAGACETAPHDGLDAYYLRCLTCGEHQLSGRALSQLRNELVTEEERALRAYRVLRVDSDAVLDLDQLHAMATVGQLPDASECIDNLVQFLARRQRPGQRLHLVPNQLRAMLGVVNSSEAVWVVGEAIGFGWVESEDYRQGMSKITPAAMRLTAKGWERHRQRMREGAGSRHAFMAMDFKQPDIGDLFSQHLAPNIKRRTDFELRTTNHAQKTAGQIDSRMRVELHTSRFVVCDLTHNNRGAYWEAGFAEGIGRPVFYLCRQDVHASTDPEVKPHFDIAHQAIVKWDPLSPGPAVEELVAMIRATLPAEARMED